VAYFLAIGAGWCGGYLFSSFWAGPAYLGYYSGAWGGLSGVGARGAAERAIFTLSTAQGPARAHPHAYPPEAHKDRPKGARLRALDRMSAFFLPLSSEPKSHGLMKTLSQNWVLAALAATWLAAQNVGIGTTTPLTRLHVAEGDIFLGEAAGANGFILRSRSSNSYDYFQISTRTGSSYEWSKGITLVRSSGNVGIGTTTPGAKLEVAGAIKVPAVGTLIFNDPNEAGTPGWDGFRIRYQDNFYGTYLDALIIEKTDYNHADPDGGISFVNTGSDGVVEPALTIRGNGNVGIGTTSPAAKLDVYGGNGTFIRVSGAMPAGDGNHGLVGYELRNSSTNHHWRMYLADPDGGFGVTPRAFEIWEYPANLGTGTCCRPRLRIMSSDGLANPTEVVINSAGNVGIGTTAPASLLHVYAPSGSERGIYWQDGSNTDLRIYRDIDIGNWALLRSEMGNGIAIIGQPDVVVLAVSRTNNNVGIGTTSPAYKLHVVGAVYATGQVYCNGAALCSDQRWKTNIKPIQNALDNVLKMQGVTYYWKVDEYPDKHFPEGEQIGFIAQEIEKSYPQVVLTDKDGYKSVDYSKLTPVLVEAIKEQQKIIEELQKVIQQLQEENSQIKQANAQLSAEIKMLNEKVDNLINSLSNDKKLGYR